MMKVLKTKRTVIKETKFDQSINVSIFIFLSILGILTISVFLNVVFISLSPTTELIKNAGAYMRFPSRPTLSNYIYVLGNNSPVIKAMIVTITRTVLGVALSLFVTVLIAYPLSKKNLPGGKAIMMIFFFTMLFNGGMIPTYLAVRSYHLLDTLWALILPGALSVYNMIIMRSFFKSLPLEMEESAKIDGCTDMKVLFKIILPLSGPCLAAIGLFYAVGHWNSFFDAVMYINNRNLWPLQLILREILLTSSLSSVETNVSSNVLAPTSMAIMCTTIVISSLPIIIVYPFIQKHFVTGIMLGAVKG